MEVNILNKNLVSQSIFDQYDSLLWTDRYFECGDFEIYAAVGANSDILEDYYLTLKESDHTMIIEKIEINSDVENGNKITVTGRSLESILDRRVVSAQTVLDGNLQVCIEALLNANAINPDDASRKINRLEFETSDDPAVTGINLITQYQTAEDSLYNIISNLCKSSGLGFKIILTDDNKFRFSLYAGKDRSYDQIQNPYVVFSPEYDNSINGKYIEDKKNLKTVTYVKSEKGVGNESRTVVVAAPGGAGTDLDRRETFTDASDISRNVAGQEEPLTDQQFDDQLTKRGQDDLATKILTKSFEGEVDTTTMYIYGQDFFMGDIVQVTNEYGNESKSRVTELVNRKDSSGIRTYPTFSAL